jgi:hypothetical protein
VATLRAVRRTAVLIALLIGLLVLAGCGSSHAGDAGTTTTASAPPGPGRTLYAGGPWAVVLDGTRATAFHEVRGAWHAERSGSVRIRILGPRGTAPRVAQIAAEISAHEPLVESGLWVDGTEVPVKGGGSETKGTIYGALGKPLAQGRHVAVAYGRSDRHATAVAWSFRVA